jgi:hypothetical protein
MGLFVLIKPFKKSTALATYQDCLEYHPKKDGVQVKNISFGVGDAEESYAVFELSYNGYVLAGFQFTAGYSFTQDFDKGELELKKGVPLKIRVKSDGTNTINANGSITVIE